VDPTKYNNLLEDPEVEDLYQEEEAPLAVVAEVEDHQEEEDLPLSDLLLPHKQQEEEDLMAT
jgi:hypothetical protein